MKLLIALLFAFTSLAANAQSCATHVIGDLPTHESKPQLLCRKGYDLLYNTRAITPLASFEKLDGKTCPSAPRINSFQPDPDVTGPKALLKDYEGAGFDRGHLTNDLDQRCDAQSERETFYLSNMVPQVPSSNRGQWRALEGWVRKQAEKLGTMYVITGPIFEGEPKTMGASKVPIPSHLYKVVYFPSLNRAVGFIVPNAENNAHYKTYLVTLAEVEKRTGLTLFANIPNLRRDDLARDLVGK